MAWALMVKVVKIIQLKKLFVRSCWVGLFLFMVKQNYVFALIA